ncbi:MAG: hypothetical protein ACXVPU_10960 [Bacteroidia bacterium]
MQSTVKRPVIIKIICILGFISIVFNFLSVFSPSIKRMGDWYPALFGLLVATSFISYIGLWHMKRWGVQLFIITFFVKEVVNIMTGDLNLVPIIITALYMIPMLLFYKRMDMNL